MKQIHDVSPERFAEMILGGVNDSDVAEYAAAAIGAGVPQQEMIEAAINTGIQVGAEASQRTYATYAKSMWDQLHTVVECMDKAMQMTDDTELMLYLASVRKPIVDTFNEQLRMARRVVAMQYHFAVGLPLEAAMHEREFTEDDAIQVGVNLVSASPLTAIAVMLYADAKDMTCTCMDCKRKRAEKAFPNQKDAAMALRSKQQGDDGLSVKAIGFEIWKIFNEVTAGDTIEATTVAAEGDTKRTAEDIIRKFTGKS